MGCRGDGWSGCQINDDDPSNFREPIGDSSDCDNRRNTRFSGINEKRKEHSLPGSIILRHFHIYHDFNILKRKEVRGLRFLIDNGGIESTEVALIIAVVVLVSYGAYRLLGQNIAEKVTDIAGKI